MKEASTTIFGLLKRPYSISKCTKHPRRHEPKNQEPDEVLDMKFTLTAHPGDFEGSPYWDRAFRQDAGGPCAAIGKHVVIEEKNKRYNAILGNTGGTVLLQCAHGIELKRIFPDDDKGHQPPTAGIEIIAKGIPIEHAAEPYMAMDDLTLDFQEKDEEQINEEERAARDEKAAEGQTDVEDFAEATE